jgi:predicted transcriptional regulator
VKVKDVYEKNSGFVDKVFETDSIEKVIQVLVSNKSTRTVFVIDKKMNLLGVITISEIFGHLFNKMKPEILTIFNKKKDLKAKDIMKVVISVSLDDDLNNAFRAAIVSKLQDLPVCEKGKLVGELDCFELLEGLIAQNKNYFQE